MSGHPAQHQYSSESHPGLTDIQTDMQHDIIHIIHAAKVKLLLLIQRIHSELVHTWGYRFLESFSPVKIVLNFKFNVLLISGVTSGQAISISAHIGMGWI